MLTAPPSISEEPDNVPTPNGLRKRLGRLNHYANIAMGAFNGKRVRTGPLYVQIGVVNTCNYRCQFCWDHPSFVAENEPYPDENARQYYLQHPEIDYDRAHMDWEIYLKLVNDLHNLGTRKIKFVGRGEPFLHRRFMDMVAYAKNRNFNVSITTNGALITQDHVRKLVKLNLDEVYISVNAASPETYSNIHMRSRPGSFEQVKSSLQLFAAEKKRLKKRRPFVQLSFVIQSNNYHELPDMVRLANEANAQRISFNRVSVYPGIRFLLPTPEQDQEIKEKLIPEVERLSDELNIESNLDSFKNRPNSAQRSKEIHTKIPCYAGWYFAIILADGTVNPCCECLRTMGSLKTNLFREIWFGEEYRKTRKAMINLPAAGSEIPGCRCYNCGLAIHNLSMHKFIHPLARAIDGQSFFGLKNLKQFVFGQDDSK